MTKTQKSQRAGRPSTRYDIHCPVTVSLRNGLNGTERIEGELWEISEDGARLLLDKPLQRGTEILLFAHFRHPHKGITTIRFQGVVEKLKEQPRFEMAVGFKGGGKFVSDEIQKLPDNGAGSGKSPRA